MKKLLIFLHAWAVVYFSVDAQNPELWATGTYGGDNNNGTIFKVNGDGTQAEYYAVFNGTNGSNPAGELMRASDGYFYGTTINGGTYNYGTIYRFDPVNHTVQKMVDFDGTKGKHPKGALIEVNGKLYGLTPMGGAHSSGTVFYYNPANNLLQAVFQFNVNISGYGAEGTLLKAHDGKLYGLASDGTNVGVLFRINPADSSFTDLHDFASLQGADPTGTLLQATDGKLYGMARDGGAHNSGTLFSFDLTTDSYADVYDFTGGANGQNPQGTLVQASNGLVYGVVSAPTASNAGDAYLFSFNTSTHALQPVHTFSANNDSFPNGDLMIASNGKIYGLNNKGGENGKGMVYSFAPTGNVYSRLLDCDSATFGSFPVGGLFQPGFTNDIKEEVTGNEVLVYPNPGKGTFIINSEHPIANLLVTDILGREVLRVAPNAITTSIQLNNPGLYFATIFSEGKTAVVRVIVD